MESRTKILQKEDEESWGKVLFELIVAMVVFTMGLAPLLVLPYIVLFIWDKYGGYAAFLMFIVLSSMYTVYHYGLRKMISKWDIFDDEKERKEVQK